MILTTLSVSRIAIRLKHVRGITNINQNEPTKVVVAMSGGVDSSVAAHLLMNMSDKSVKVSGLHMSNWNALDEDDAETTDIAATTCRGSTANEREESAETKRDVHQKKRSSASTFCEASEQEYSDSRAVAQHLSIQLHRVSFASEYWIEVFEPFVESLSAPTSNSNNGATCGELTMPNPDFGCNTYIKFGAMKDYALNKLKADFVATGHYAQLWHRVSDFSSSNKHRDSNFFRWMEETSTKLEHQVYEAIAGRPEEDWLLSNYHGQLQSNSHCPKLLAGADRSKDQTYFLSGVKTENFRNIVFPLGHLHKSRQYGGINDKQSVRDIAIHANIPTASKKDSMGICFIGKRNFGQFVSQYLPEIPQPGPFVDIDTGEIIGYHQGSMHYTSGQGAKISGANTKYFVCGKGVRSEDNANIVFVCNNTHHPSLYTDELLVDFGVFNWIGLGASGNDSFSHIPMPLRKGQSIELLARTRHLQPLVPCTIRHVSDRGNSPYGMLSVKFHKPMRAITPGQIFALYAGDGFICLGGGPIHSRGQTFMERGLEVSLSKLHPSGHNDLSLRQQG